MASNVQCFGLLCRKPKNQEAYQRLQNLLVALCLLSHLFAKWHPRARCVWKEPEYNRGDKLCVLQIGVGSSRCLQTFLGRKTVLANISPFFRRIEPLPVMSSRERNNHLYFSGCFLPCCPIFFFVLVKTFRSPNVFVLLPPPFLTVGRALLSPLTLPFAPALFWFPLDACPAAVLRHSCREYGTYTSAGTVWRFRPSGTCRCWGDTSRRWKAPPPVPNRSGERGLTTTA